LPCPSLPRPYLALPLPCPAPAHPLPLPLPCPVSNFPFGARDRRKKLHREQAVFFFSFCCQGQEEEVT